MKRLIGFGTAIVVLSLSRVATAQDHDHSERQEGETPRLGAEVKDFALKDNTGEAFRLGTLRRTEKSKGTIAVLTFWCTTCVSCRQMEKDFDKKAREYKGKGVLYTMVASNSAESADQVNRFQEKNELSFPVLMDSESEIAWYFGATRTTTTAVIDAGGRLRYYGDYTNAEDAVRDLMVGKEVAVAESRPNG